MTTVQPVFFPNTSEDDARALHDRPSKLAASALTVAAAALTKCAVSYLVAPAQIWNALFFATHTISPLIRQSCKPVVLHSGHQFKQWNSSRAVTVNKLWTPLPGQALTAASHSAA
jgi:hypothetical protein